MTGDSPTISTTLDLDEAVGAPTPAVSPLRTAGRRGVMLLQVSCGRNRGALPWLNRVSYRGLRRGIGVVGLASTLVILAAAGCARPERTLQVWRQSARMEHVSRFEFEREPTREQWFTRVLDPASLPPGCIFPLSDRFDFLVVSKPAQWEQLLRATNLRDEAIAPDFHDGVVIGLMARVGEMRLDRWPILITSVRQRGRIAFLYAEFQEGFYRPLSVPTYLHLINLRGVDTFLGVKLNHLLFGFNVEIDDLNAVGIH